MCWISGKLSRSWEASLPPSRGVAKPPSERSESPEAWPQVDEEALALLTQSPRPAPVAKTSSGSSCDATTSMRVNFDSSSELTVTSAHNSRSGIASRDSMVTKSREGLPSRDSANGNPRNSLYLFKLLFVRSIIAFRAMIFFSIVLLQ